MTLAAAPRVDELAPLSKVERPMLPRRDFRCGSCRWRGLLYVLGGEEDDQGEKIRRACPARDCRGRLRAL